VLRKITYVASVAAGGGTMYDMHSVITGVFWPSITSRHLTCTGLVSCGVDRW
jgi:hypothetical protein